jgi:hypothetical protein
MEIEGSGLRLDMKKGARQLNVPQKVTVVPQPDRLTLGWDFLEFSVQNFEFLHVRELMKAIPDVREERITQVRDDIEDGTYNVIADRIAKKIIRGDPLVPFA